MTGSVIAFLTAMIFVTAFISGMFGMAGGLILMSVMLTLLPLATAVVLQSSIQLVSNVWRCILWRRYIVWHVIPWYFAGIALGITLMLVVQFVPDKNTAFLVMGTLPLLSMAVGSRLRLHIENPYHTFPAAACLTFVHLTAGVVGPLLDLLYVNAAFTRQQIIATKAFNASIMHIVRVLHYGVFVMLMTGEGGWPKELDPVWMGLFIVVSVAGTTTAAWFVHRMTDDHFKIITRVLVVLVSLYCLYQGITGKFGL